MCKKLVSTMQQEAALQTVAPPGIRALFEDWIGHIEKEILALAREHPGITPEILARKFNISIEGSAFLVQKLKAEGRI